MEIIYRFSEPKSGAPHIIFFNGLYLILSVPDDTIQVKRLVIE